MAVACDANSLAASANCLKERLNPKQMEAAKVYLLASLAGLTLDSTLPDVLMASSKCIEERMSKRQLRASQVYLLCQILNK